MISEDKSDDFGAYGLRLSGIGGRLVESVPPGWPRMCIRQARPTGPPPDEMFSHEDGRAEIRFTSLGSVVVTRDPLEATFLLREPATDDEILHPLLASPAAIAAAWNGRTPFHAGGVVVGGRAWGVLGSKTAGKSSLLAWMARRGHAVLADDLLVIEGTTALAGPRSADLRPDSAERLGAVEHLVREGSDPRFRLPLGEAPPEVPLGGWIVLEWGEAVSLSAVPPQQRIPHFGRFRVPYLPLADPAVLLDLAEFPVVRLTRPKDWSRMEEVERLLLERLPAG